MTTESLTHTSAPISITAAWGAIAGIVSYQILLIVLIFLRPDLDPSWQTQDFSFLPPATRLYS